MTFENARIKLIAGDVNRIQNEDKDYELKMYVCESSAALGGKAFFDYHMYTLKHLTTLKDNQANESIFLVDQKFPLSSTTS